MKQGIEFLSLTAQALVLLVANMSGGGFMNLSSLKFVFCVSYEIRNLTCFSYFHSLSDWDIR